ncbi:MAG: PQQ-binding-like beta-propeller repeat protein [Thermoproteota archaeon]|nr:PQQ-binding-like beta-propeller repeat protein [Thermoproteota archaeon]
MNDPNDFLIRSQEHSWKMFRGNPMRTGISRSTFARKPSLEWLIELGPIIASPVFDNSILYVPTVTGRIYALNVYKRRIKYHFNIGSPIISSPLLHKDMLIAATFDSWINETIIPGKNSVFALDTRTGDQIWNFEIHGNVFSSPCVVGVLIVLGSLDGHIYAIDMEGNVRWTYETQGQIWSSPSFNGDKIFIGSDDGFLYCLDLDGSLQWKRRLNGKIRSSTPCLSSDGLIFIGTHAGGMYCLCQHDGLIKWNKQISEPILASSAVLVDKVFFASSDKKIYCLYCNNGSRLWEFETGDRIWSSPVIIENNEAMFFGCLDSHIYGLNSSTGNLLWKFPTMDIIDSSPCIASNMLFIGSRDGLLYVFGLQTQASYIR